MKKATPITTSSAPRYAIDGVPVPQLTVYRPTGKMDICIDDKRYNGARVRFYAIRPDDQIPALNGAVDRYGESRYKQLLESMLGHEVDTGIMNDNFSQRDGYRGDHFPELCVLDELNLFEAMTFQECRALEAFLEEYIEGGGFDIVARVDLPAKNFSNGQMLVPCQLRTSPMGVADIEISAHPYWGLNFRVFAHVVGFEEDEGIDVEPAPSVKWEVAR